MFAAVVLAGGAARRLGGTAKPYRTVGGVALLDRVLAVVAGADPRIVVGPSDLVLPAGVLRTRERPPGGGPVAAIAAGLRLLSDPAGPPAAEPPATVAVLAADLPFLTTGTVDRLRTACLGPGRQAAVLVDAAGRPQWLCAVWRLDALRARLADLGDPTGASMRRLTGAPSATGPGAGTETGKDIEEVPDVELPPAGFDCDTEDDLRRAEEWAHGEHP